MLTSNIHNTSELNLDDYLVPISSKNSCGEYLRYENEYDQIIYALKKDNPNLEQGVWKKELKKPDWQKIINLCDELLKTKTKDLQIVAWFTLALSHVYGIESLELGLKLLLSLSQKYWDSIFPFSTDDPEYRFSPFVWLDEKLPNELITLPITNDSQTDHFYTYEQWEMENLLSTDANEQEYDPLISYLKHVSITDLEYHSTLDKSLSSSLNYLEELKSYLISQNEEICPHFVMLKDTLDGIKLLNSYALEEITKLNNLQKQLVAKESTEIKLENNEQKQVLKFKNPTEFTKEEIYKQLKTLSNFLVESNPNDHIGQIIKHTFEMKQELNTDSN